MRQNTDTFSREELFRYFRDGFSEDEKMRLDKWLGENPDNAVEFRNARILFDAVLMHSDIRDLQRGSGTAAPDSRAMKKKAKRRKIWRRIAVVAANAAAVAAFAVIFGTVSKNEMERELCSTMIDVEIPSGQSMNLKLADGTTVFLNSGARFSYPTRFSSKERNVSIEGEGFFSVAKDSSRPFKVKTFAADVEVLGTKFNICADPVEGEFAATVQEGRVAVTELSGRRHILGQDEQVEISDGKSSHTKVDASDSMRWMQGIISLDAGSFTKLMHKFEQAYGVTIVVQMDDVPELKNLRGSIRRSEGIDYAMSILQEIVPFSYSRDVRSNTIRVYEKTAELPD